MISIIIPTFNEAGHIGDLVNYLKRHLDNVVEEIIVSDGGSTDETVSLAAGAGAITISAPGKGRALQMNFGASQATGDILYFIHADTFPPIGFATAIEDSIDSEHEFGCFRLSFDHSHWFLKFNCWFTRFNLPFIHFGDQSLFITKHLFERGGGFRENMLLLEDQEIIYRLLKHSKFRVLHASVTTSARKYIDNGIYRLQGAFFYVYLLYRLGYSQEILLKKYQSFITQDKM